MSSEESPVEMVRRNNREMEYQVRREHRQMQVNSMRGTLGEVANSQRVMTALEVKSLAEKLKHKSHFTVHDFMLLNHALIQNEENIIAFFKVTGALHALVRELTGQNASLQLAAANCCCNLALGNEKSCLMLTKAAAPYLISHLDGLNNHMLEICIWTLGNLAGSHVKSWTILHTQGLLPKLLHLVTSTSSDVVQATLYALNHYVKTGLHTNNLTSELLRNIVMNVHHLMETEDSACWLIYLLSCCTECSEELLSNSVVSRAVKLLEQCTIDMDSDMKISKTTALVRILGNLSVNNGAAELLLTSSSVVSILQMLLKSPYLHIQHETLWLIGNLFNHSSAEIQLLAKSSSLEDTLEPMLSDVISKIL